MGFVSLPAAHGLRA